MGEALRIFGIYLWAVFSHWQAYATGGSVTALMLVYERFVATIPKNAFAWIVLVFFVMASTFGAWRDAYSSMKGRERDLHASELATIRERAEKESFKSRMEALQNANSTHPASTSIMTKTTDRPYLVIEPITAAEHQEMALRGSPRNPVLPDRAYGPAWVVAKTLNGETLFYNFKNIGILPAKKIAHYQSIKFVGEFDDTVKLEPPMHNGAILLYRDQTEMYQVSVPDGTVYTGIPGEKRKIRIKLLVTFGDSDPNTTFYYQIVLLATRSRSVEARSEAGNTATVTVESSDDGIVGTRNNSIQDLIR